MQKHQFPTLSSILLLGFGCLAILYALAGIPAVPFHPDESTQIYMSSDLPAHLSTPGLLSWQPGQETQPRTRYRLLDAPLARLLIGLGQAVSRQPAQLADWNWSASWTQNQSSGALPSPGSLIAGRASITLLLPLTLLLVYVASRRFLPTWAAGLAAILLTIHPLTLLHARRAMAEGPLLFSICLFLYALTRPQPSAWLLGLSAALAFNAKQSAIFLIPASLLALFLLVPGEPKIILAGVRRTLIYAAVFLGVTLALNPVLWRYPLQAAQVMLQARQELLAAQVADFRQAAPQLVLDSRAERALVLAIQPAIAPPSFSETGNYTAQTAAAVEVYRSALFQGGLPGAPWTGGLLLVLAVFGTLTALLDLRRPSSVRPALALVLAAGMMQFIGLVLTVPLAFQRYAIPILPFFCFLTVYGFHKVAWVIQQIVSRKYRPV